MTPHHRSGYPVPSHTAATPQHLMHRHALILLTATLLAPPLTAAAPSDGWYRSLAEARKVSRDSGRPLFVVFRCET